MVILVVMCAVGGCAGAAPEPSAGPRPDTLLPAAPAPTTAGPNLRPCASVEASVTNLRVPLGGWTPEAKPFDATVASTLRSTATDVQHQERAATGPVRQAIHDWGAALMHLSTVMRGKDAAAVTTAATAVKTTFIPLKAVCKFDQ